MTENKKIFNLKLNQKYSGFLLKERQKKKTEKINFYLFIHQKNGAEVLFIENDDPDKFFSIAFKTPSFSSSGINHILEHSVLQGSKKYPVPDIFTFLLKSTSSTFINAMTYPDKTVYPVASLYESEFQKLMKVYCDAVFNPLVLEKEEIFQQEKMVVFNEMKGAVSSIERIIEQEILTNLFPDNFYKYNSGGEPEEILTLTHQQLKEHHQEFYQPSNSYTLIYGQTNILKHLEYLDKNYFNKYEKKIIKSNIKLQKKWQQPIYKNKKYFFIGENLKNKNIFNLAFLMPAQNNRQDILGLSILFSLLLGHQTAPLKKVLLKSKIGEKIVFDFWTQETIQTVFSLTLKNTNQKDKKKFQKIFFETLQKIAQQGFAIEAIQAKLNKVEFAIFQQKNKTQKGLSFLENISLNWLNNFGYETALETEKHFQEIKKNISKKYFEKLIKKYLLNNNNYIFLNFQPSRKNNLEKLKFTGKTCYKTDEYQKVELTPLEISKLPKKSNLGKLAVHKNKDDVKFLYLKSKNQKISEITFSFEARVIKTTEIQYLQLLAQVLEEMFSEEFKRKIDLSCGSLSLEGVQIYQNKKKVILPKFVFSIQFLNKNLLKVNKIIEQIFSDIKFDKEKVEEKIKNIENSLETELISSGHNFALSLAAKNLNEKSFLTEQVNGFSYYSFIKNIETKNITIILERIYQDIFQSNNLIISFVSEKNIGVKIYLPKKKLEIKKIKKLQDLPVKTEKIAIGTASQVQYNALVADFSQNKIKFHGSFHIFNIILKYQYLWEAIREKGGAYGCFSIMERSGIFGFVSYRDPRLKETFSDYQRIIKNIEKVKKIKPEEINQFIVKAISSLDAPITEFQELNILSTQYISDISTEDFQKERDEILATKPEDFKKFINLIKILKTGQMSTLGSQKIINDQKNFFQKIIKL